MITGDLLLIGTHGESLHVRMQQSTSISKVLDGDFGSNRDFERRFGKVVAFQVGLEERAHLCISGSGSVKNQKVKLEAKGVDAERNQDEANSSGYPMFKVGHLTQRHLSAEVYAGQTS